MNERSIDAQRFRAALPPDARRIITRLQEAGGQAYLVGGCLRDLILERPVKDWDIATDLTPDRIRPLFRRVVEVGARFGTVVVPRRGNAYEITTFRTEGRYTDGRHPDEVAYSGELRADLERRDFTVNAMAWDPRRDEIEDPFGGLTDIERRLIRAVGDPAARFREDALRLMRAVRQATQLGFRIERRTLAAVHAEAAGLERISAERIRDELNALLLAEKPSRGLQLLHHTGLLQIVLPELEACFGVAQNRFHTHDLFRHSIFATDAAPRELVVRLAVLLHDIGKPDTREERGEDYTFYAHQLVGAKKARRIMRRLRYSNEEIEQVTHLIYHHMFYYEPEWTDSAIRRFVRTVGLENIPSLIAVRLADMAGNPRKTGSTVPLEELLRRVDEVIAKDTALSVRDLVINGRDLLEMGVPEGRGIGRILRALLDRVIDDPELNAREPLLAAARELLEAGYHLRPDAHERPREGDDPTAD